MHRILVIDDEPRIIEILISFLTMEGYNVTAASNGKEALDVLKEKGMYDLIILDEKMPVMAGAPFLVSLRKKQYGMPVIILTGSLNAEQIKYLDKSLFQHILHKPIRLVELLKLIRKYLPEKEKTKKKGNREENF